MTTSNTSKTHKKATTPDTTELIGPNTKLELVLPWKEVAVSYQKVLRKLAAQVKVPGFRKGKVPTKVAEEQVGRAKLMEQVLDELVPAAYTKLIQDQDKRPLTNPEITPLSLEWEQDWKLSIEIAEKPAVEVKKYQDVVKKARKEVEKELVEQEKQVKKAKKGAKPGKPDADAHDHDHDHDHAHAHPHQHTRELTEEQKREHTLHHIFRDLAGTFKPQIPELLLKEETRQELNRLVSELKRLNLSLDDYLKRRGQQFEDLTSELAAAVLGRLQLEFVLDKIEDELQLEVNEQELSEEVEKIKDEKLREQLKNDARYKTYLRNQLKRQKTVDFLLTLK